MFVNSEENYKINKKTLNKIYNKNHNCKIMKYNTSIKYLLILPTRPKIA